ncbi:isoprenylcysteine carboxylmethyltransferase family protein [Paraglaciecola aquimarina]|uniref:Isoprenylcysteine carboxylmethyltransferase family protein n=1 Tax=Paraglaciecola aquimarina TaxID=1235557 RepID=A0ABU3SZG3_9ALTE|nr:isoprenylcysteine carboxylmethyltransferase family protein [Paraglaciecola aquimarina]MDU0355405.1 isoprenylcysteine carboxylmethyltransferase family protein [Paraglaciecola aquimarina]
MDKLKLKVPPVAVFVVLVSLVFLLKHTGIAFIVPMNDHFTPTVLIAVGCVFGILGVWEFRKQNTTVNPHTPNKASSLVTSGIYRVSRNPMYFGLLLILIAVILRLENVLGFIAIPLFILYMNHFQIKPEEQIVESIFNDEYREYKNKVRRWI